MGRFTSTIMTMLRIIVLMLLLLILSVIFEKIVASFRNLWRVNAFMMATVELIF